VRIHAQVCDRAGQRLTFETHLSFRSDIRTSLQEELHRGEMPPFTREQQRRASAAIAGREVGTLGDMLRHELLLAELGRRQQQVPGKNCLNLLLLDLIIAEFGKVESG
jgi:hypothetical protein